MKKVLSLFLLSVLSVSGCYFSGNEEDISKNVKDQFLTELDCDGSLDSEYEEYCAVTRIDDFNLILPTEAQTYLGLSIALIDTESVVSSIDTTQHISALHIGPDTARLTTLVASTEEDQSELDRIASSLKNILSGVEYPFDITADLASYLESEREFEGYAILESTVTSATYNSPLPYTIYYTEDAYIVIEDAVGGVYISVFPNLPVS